MARPKKEVKVKKNKAVKKLRTNKIKDSFLEIGKTYNFYRHQGDNIYGGKLLDINKTEFYIQGEEGKHIIDKNDVFEFVEVNLQL